MPVEFYKALWGMDGTLAQQLSRIQAAGYDGFEGWVPHIAPAEIRQAASDHGLKFIGQHLLDSVDSLESALAHSREAGATKAVVHAGKDWWSFDEGCRFFEKALGIVSTVDIPVCFETHRGRLLFTPGSTLEYVTRFPDLRLTADFSHWVVVCESMLQDQKAAVDLAISRTSHLHARVGHEEGPQVGDPRTSLWSSHVDRFEIWWDAIRQAHEERGDVFTVDPEFGPPQYQPTEPNTNDPLADVWDVSLWMRDRLKSRWA